MRLPALNENPWSSCCVECRNTQSVSQSENLNDFTWIPWAIDGRINVVLLYQELQNVVFMLCFVGKFSKYI